MNHQPSAARARPRLVPEIVEADRFGGDPRGLFQP